MLDRRLVHVFAGGEIPAGGELPAELSLNFLFHWATVGGIQILDLNLPLGFLSGLHLYQELLYLPPGLFLILEFFLGLEEMVTYDLDLPLVISFLNHPGLDLILV